MFESAEVGHSIDKDTYEKAVIELREALLEAQFELKQQARFPVIILINGIEGAGKGETVKLLNEWMDPRLIEVQSFLRPSDEELERPPQWRFWRRLPPKGRTGIFFGNWYSQMLYARVEGHIKEAKLDQAIDAAERFERMLCDEGALLFKFWFHLSKKQLKERLKALEKDPQHSWKLSPLDWKQSEVYDRFVHYGERVLRRTSRDYAPWYVVEGVDERYRALTVGRILLEGLQAALATKERAKRQPHAAPLVSSLDNRGLLDSLDLGQYLDKDAYKEQLAAEQARLAGLIRDKRFRQHSLVAVFEGNDAAGKGGAIRRVTDALDPRQYHIVPIAAPTEEERAALSLALLAAHPGAPPVHHLRPFLVRPRAGRTHRGLLRTGRLAARLWRDQRLRGAAQRVRDHRGEVLAGDRQADPDGALQGARENPLQALQDHRGRLAQPRQVGPVRGRGGRHGRPYQHRDRALDPGRSQRQALRPGQGAAHHQRRHRGGVQEGQVRPAGMRRRPLQGMATHTPDE